MAVDAVTSVVLQKLRDLLVDESFASNKIIGHRLKRLKEVLESTSSPSFVESPDDETDAQDIINIDYLSHLYSIEDLIESFALSFTSQRKKLGCLMNHALFLKKFTALKMLDSKLYSIQTKVKKQKQKLINGQSQTTSLERRDKSLHQISSSPINEEETDGPGSSMMKRTMSSPSVAKLQERPINLRKNHSFKVLSRSHASTIRERWEQSKLMYSYSYNEEELSIVGYQGKVAELRHRLENPDDRIIPIVGALGSGKTMLARAIYGNRSIKNMFTPCAWANIFKESTTTDILLALLNQMNKSRVENGSCEISLKKRLSQQLKKRKYLIVLDGVQKWEQWESLQDAFPHEESGNKIILTTCDDSYSKWQPYNLEVLNSEESWTLFMTKLGSQTDPEPSLKERIIQICRGLPLNIVLLGSLLSMKDREKWSETLNIHRKWQTSEIMKLSYNDLDNHMKLCLIYMTLFPKELDIPVRRLQRLWLAEGFVEQPHKEGEFQEDVALGYFENLVKRSLIMVSKQRSDGSARRCRLQGALHGLLVEQGREIHLFQVHHDHKSSAREHTRRLVEYADGGNSQLQLSQFQKVRSYISFNFQKKDTPAKHVGSLVRKWKLLRVLDLEGVYQPSLPENLGDLFHLRYLGLRWTFLEKLPKSVGELPHLQTLDLKHTRIEKIPTSIWKLKTLKHLNLDEVHLDKDTLLHLRRSLPELLTLWGLSVTHQSPIQNGLNKLRDLRELGITFRFIKKNNNMAQDAGQSTEALVEWISRLIHLRSLRLRSIDDSGNPLDLSLKPLSSLGKLSHMKLLGRLQQLPPLGHFPPHIKVLTLSLSYLSEDPMPILGQLPDLTVLRLLGNSYLGETMVCSSGRFKNLEVLKLWMLENLKKWEVEDGAMEKLKEVNIRRCSEMESFPTNLLQQKSFQDLILNNMPPAFKENIDSKYLFKVSTKDYEFES